MLKHNSWGESKLTALCLGTASWGRFPWRGLLGATVPVDDAPRGQGNLWAPSTLLCDTPKIVLVMLRTFACQLLFVRVRFQTWFLGRSDNLLLAIQPFKIRPNVLLFCLVRYFFNRFCRSVVIFLFSVIFHFSLSGAGGTQNPFVMCEIRFNLVFSRA